MIWGKGERVPAAMGMPTLNVQDDEERELHRWAGEGFEAYANSGSISYWLFKRNGSKAVA